MKRQHSTFMSGVLSFLEPRNRAGSEPPKKKKRKIQKSCMEIFFSLWSLPLATFSQRRGRQGKQSFFCGVHLIQGKSMSLLFHLGGWEGKEFFDWSAPQRPPPTPQIWLPNNYPRHEEGPISPVLSLLNRGCNSFLSLPALFFFQWER